MNKETELRKKEFDISKTKFPGDTGKLYIVAAPPKSMSLFMNHFIASYLQEIVQNQKKGRI